MFTYMLGGLARAYVPRIEEALCIGMGIGIVPRELAREGVRVDVVEINPGIVPVAERYFDLDTDRFSLFIGDGRYFVSRASARYDAVLLDAFLGDSNPSHLMSREAFTDISRVLRPDGVLVINTFVKFDDPEDFFGASLYKTLASVFASVRVHGARDGNTLYVASPRTDLAMAHEPDLAGVHRDALEQVKQAYAQVWKTPPVGGMVLTDDYNPVEFYDAANRERLRRSLAIAMRGG